VHAIQSRPEADAMAIFNRIREGVDVESILQRIRAGDQLLQLQISLETKYRYDFPYRDNMPAHLLVENNLYLRSLIYSVAFQSSMSKGKMNVKTTVTESTIPLARDDFPPQYLQPSLASSVEDERLGTVRPSKWTDVSSDDELMRTLLRSYFHQEYDCFTIFHKDHFLDDMNSGSTRYCSSLLVNIILAFGCVRLLYATL
jgi:hypothetical protein